MLSKLKAVQLAWQFRHELFIGAAVLLILPALLVAMVAGASLAVVPMVPDNQVALYQKAVADLRAPDGSKLIGLRWQVLVAIDAVRNRQDFTKVTEPSIRELAQKFVKEVHDPGGGACKGADAHCVCKVERGGMVCTLQAHTRYEVRSADEVSAMLGMTEDQRQQMFVMGSVETPQGCLGGLLGHGGPFAIPVDGPLTTCFGMRESPTEPGITEMHLGVDIAAEYGTPVHAATAGKVHLADVAGGYGNLVILLGDDGMQTWYGHLSRFAVKVGNHVEQGAVIGYVGSTGRSTGPHLHFEMRPKGGNPVDPLNFYR